MYCKVVNGTHSCVLTFQATDLTAVVLWPRGDYAPFFHQLSDEQFSPLAQSKVSVTDWGSWWWWFGGWTRSFFSGWADFSGDPNFRERVKGWGLVPLDIASGDFLGTLSSGNWVATLKKRNERREGADDVSGDVYSPCHITVNTVGTWALQKRFFTSSCTSKGKQS